jgi:hypothetical protein
MELPEDDPRKDLSNMCVQIQCLRKLVAARHAVASRADKTRLTANIDLAEASILVRLLRKVLVTLTDKLQLMFKAEELEAIQHQLHQLEPTEKSRHLLNILQDRK